MDLVIETSITNDCEWSICGVCYSPLNYLWLCEYTNCTTKYCPKKINKKELFTITEL